MGINQVWGGPNSGIDGGNNDGRGKRITDTPGGVKLQAEGHPVLYRNIWIKELDLVEADTDLKIYNFTVCQSWLEADLSRA